MPIEFQADDPYYRLLIDAGLLNSQDPNFEIDEDRYLAFCEAFFQEDKFVEFLHHTLCTYPAINDFLIKVLALANQKQEGFDT